MDHQRISVTADPSVMHPVAASTSSTAHTSKRRNRAVAKLDTAAEPTRYVSPDLGTITAQLQSRSTQANLHPTSELEILTCEQCASPFERMRVRGRKPTLCPTCRATAPE